MDWIEQKVKQTICDCFCVDLKTIEDNSIRLSDLDADSLDLIDFEFQLNNQFDDKLFVEFEANAETTIQDVINYVRQEISR